MQAKPLRNYKKLTWLISCQVNWKRHARVAGILVHIPVLLHLLPKLGCGDQLIAFTTVGNITIMSTVDLPTGGIIQ